MARNFNYTKIEWQDGTILQPAKVTVQGTEYEVEPEAISGQTPIDAINLDKMDSAIETIIEEELPSVINVELLAVTDVAPSECSTGDKYYNTEDKKIYTATGENTWSSTGETPLDGILYVLFDVRNTFAWDGEDLIRVGGGGTTDYTDLTNKPTINNTVLTGNLTSNDLNIITNAYSTSTTAGYSAKYINDNIGGTTDYTNLTNKPTINNTVLTGNLTSNDLNIITNAYSTSTTAGYSAKYINNNISGIIGGTITNGTPYKTGKKYNGKDVYRLIKNLGNLPAGVLSDKAISIGITNFTLLAPPKIMYSGVVSSITRYYPSPFVGSSNINTWIGSDGKAYVTTATDRSSFKIIVDIEFIYNS